MWILWSALAILALSLAAFVLFVLFDLVRFAINKIKEERAEKKLADDFIGLMILSERLERQRKAQVRHIKERDAADSELFDKAEEARRDFD